MNRNLPHVVIIGGGFAGLRAARELADSSVRITMLDRRNHHLFQPLLYQVATAALNPSDIAVPIRSILRRQENVTVILGDARSIDPDRRVVMLEDGELAYDYLIVATGATHSYFGHEEWEAHAPGLKTLEDALLIRRRILYAFETAERERDDGRRREWMTFVVVGAGPTGVELAGSLKEISRFTLSRDFRNINPEDARVLLVEGLPRVLPPYPPSLSRSAREQLERIGVEVRTEAMVTNVTARGVEVDGEMIAARTVLWGAGVKASPLAATLGAPLDKAGRVEVEPTLAVPGHPEIFVVGDLALVQTDEGEPVPGVAPAAMQEGRHAARNIARLVAGREPLPFRYVDKGSLATIGRAAAVAAIGPFRLSGFVAWLTWLAVHIFFLIGFRNRVMVLLEWAWAYLSHRRGARLITGDPEEVAREEGIARYDDRRTAG